MPRTCEIFNGWDIEMELYLRMQPPSLNVSANARYSYGRTWCLVVLEAILQVLPLDTYSSYQAD